VINEDLAVYAVSSSRVAHGQLTDGHRKRTVTEGSWPHGEAGMQRATGMLLLVGALDAVSLSCSALC